MTDYDVLNVNWPAPQPQPATLTTLESHVPAVVIGTRAQFEQAAEYFERFKFPEGADDQEANPKLYKRFHNKKGKRHLSDMILISYAIEQGVFEKKHVAFGYKEERPAAADAPLVHFSHSAVHLHGGGKGRNRLMKDALRALDDGEWTNA
jgi:hypothetical protein